MLSTEQQRRIDLYQQFFQSAGDIQRPTRRLYGWTPPWQVSQWNRELQQPGAALVALPVALQRPDVGEEVFIPHGLIELRQGLKAVGATTTFNQQTGHGGRS